MAKRTTPPKWFEEWEHNDYWHLVMKVNLNSKILWAILAGLIGVFCMSLVTGWFWR